MYICICVVLYQCKNYYRTTFYVIFIQLLFIVLCISAPNIQHISSTHNPILSLIRANLFVTPVAPPLLSPKLTTPVTVNTTFRMSHHATYRSQFLQQRRQPFPLEYSNDNYVETDTWSSDNHRSDFIFLGDSIVKYVTGLHNTQVIAFKGITLEQLGTHILQEKIPHIQTKQLITLHAGTNNVDNGDDVTELLRKTHYLIDMTRQAAPNAVIILSLIVPRLCDFTTSNDVIEPYNQAVTELSTAFGIQVIHSYRPFLLHDHPRRNLYAIDRLHLEWDGTRVLKNYLARITGMIRTRVSIPRTPTRQLPPTIIMVKGKSKRQRRH